MVDDVEAAGAFYTEHFGFTVLSSAVPAFADVIRGNLRLLLSGRQSAAGRPMPDGRQPEPGGWNRIHLIVEDLPAEVERLRAAGLTFRNDIVKGPGACRSWSTTRLATRSSCSNRVAPGRSGSTASGGLLAARSPAIQPARVEMLNHFSARAELLDDLEAPGFLHEHALGRVIRVAQLHDKTSRHPPNELALAGRE
jgi:catechol 2,3-dioxygenase-like lactoylglutathione lyase family enzyme